MQDINSLLVVIIVLLVMSLAIELLAVGVFLYKKFLLHSKDNRIQQELHHLTIKVHEIAQQTKKIADSNRLMISDIKSELKIRDEK